MFTKTVGSDMKNDYLLAFNSEDQNAVLYDLKASFFIRKNKYTEEGQSGKQNCIRMNVKNLNKGDLIDIKTRLARLNVIFMKWF